MLDLFNIIIFFMAVATFFVVFSKKIIFCLIGLSVFSFLVTVSLFILQAPDLAITEAALGVGLSTLIYLTAIKKMRRKND